MAPEGTLRTLLGVKEPNKAKRIVIFDAQEICVGRSPENDIVVDDTEASRRHLLFVRNYSGFQVQDLGTANGTTVNGEAISEAHDLANKDIVRVGELELTFIQTRKDPAGLGLEVVYASQLKDMGAAAALNQNPEATTLGLVAPAGGGFEVGAVGDMPFDPTDSPTAPRDLDLEFANFPGNAAATAGGDRLSLNLELEGLSPDLSRTLQSLFGKVIELPAMKVRIKSDD